MHCGPIPIESIFCFYFCHIRSVALFVPSLMHLRGGGIHYVEIECSHYKPCGSWKGRVIRTTYCKGAVSFEKFDRRKSNADRTYGKLKPFYSTDFPGTIKDYKILVPEFISDAESEGIVALTNKHSCPTLSLWICMIALYCAHVCPAFIFSDWR